MLDIPQDTFHRAYNNVANSTLWFVHHMLFDTPYQPVFGREFRRDWESYLAYNQAFADALADEALAEGTRRGQAPPAGTCALIQDYHLSLAPRLLRERLGDAARGIGVAHFSHTPWAPPRYYRLLPREVGRALLDGMLGADHLAFHAEWWAAAFLDCCEAILGADVSRPGSADLSGDRNVQFLRVINVPTAYRAFWTATAERLLLPPAPSPYPSGYRRRHLAFPGTRRPRIRT
jgi:trehalose 6-phosphate synthase